MEYKIPSRATFTTREVADVLGVVPRQVAQWFDSGRLKGYRIPGTQDRRIPRDNLVMFVLEYQNLINEAKEWLRKRDGETKPQQQSQADLKAQAAKEFNHGGGRAFPGPAQHEQQVDIHEGMDLLDWFAGQALAGALASEWALRDSCKTQAGVARRCYDLAAAMLADKQRRQS